MDLFLITPKSHCEYIWLWSRQEEPEIQRIRHMLQSWFDLLEDKNYKKELVQRFSGNGCHGAFFELFCFHWLTARGYRVIPQDHLPGPTADFLVQDAEGSDLFYLECTAICDSMEDNRKDKFIEQIKAVFKDVLPEDIGVHIEFGDMNMQPSLKEIRRFITDQLAVWKELGQPENQEQVSYKTVHFRFQFFSDSNEVSWVSASRGHISSSDSEKIRKHLKEKVSKAAVDSNIPFVIASNLADDLGRGHNDFTMQQVFLGDYYVTMGTGEGQHDLKTTFWFDAGRKPINTRVSGVMYFANVSPDNTEHCGSPVIWHHPEAQKRLNPPLFKGVSQWVLDESRQVLQLITPNP